VSFGAGVGIAFGGDPPVPVSEPVAAIGAPAPITIDFSDQIDGALPGIWERFALVDDGAGNKTTEIESAPDTYFRVVGGRAGWFYKRSPAMPAVATAFVERGVVASPQGIIVGRNAEVAVVFDTPTQHLAGGGNQEFRFEVMVGLRADDTCTAFVGGRLRAEWSGGSWTVPLVVEAVSVDGAAPVVLGSAVLPTYNASMDAWATRPTHELRVTVGGELLTVALDGVISTQVAIADMGSMKPVIYVRAFNRTGAIIAPFPAIVALQFRTLRDYVRLGAPPARAGDIDLEAPLLPKMHLPLGDFLSRRYIKQTGGRTFVVLMDFEAEVPGGKHAFLVGDILRATEPYEGQLLTSAVFDLAAMRAARRDF
jgi:hypothetical protein